MKSAIRVWLAAVLSFFLIACGGGGSISDSGGGGGGTTPPTDKITVTTFIAFSGSNNTISVDKPAVVTANVKGSISGVQVGKLVKFELNDVRLGVFSPLTGTALTDANGNASITLTAGEISGAGTVTASTDTGEKSAPFGFNVIGSVPPTDKITVSTSIAFTGDKSTIGFDTPAVVTANVKGTISGVQAGKLVKFELNDPKLGVLNPLTGTALTDSNGNASITLTAGQITGSGTVTASLDSGEKSAPFGFNVVGSIPPVDKITIITSIAFTGANSSVGIDKPAVVTANVKGSISGVQAGKLVKFELNDNKLGVFNPLTGTALTDSNGNASITLTAGEISGSGTVTASIDSGEKSAPFGFNVIGSVPPTDKISVSTFITFTGANSTVGVNTPAVVTANVKGAISGVQAGKLVKFQLNDAKLGVLNPLTGTALTDANGNASITLTAGEITGSGTVTASLESGEKSSPFGFNVIGSLPPTDKITVSTSIAFTGVNSTIDVDKPAVVTANVRGSISGVQAGKVVKFELNDPKLGLLNPSTGTALTDSKGNASITLTAGELSGAGTLVASIDSGEKSIPFGFNVIGSVPPTDKITVSTSIAFTGTNSTIGVNTPAVVTAKVKGAISGVQVGKLVKFELNDGKLGVFNPVAGTALTDSNGNASITLTAGEISGSGTVTASIDSGEKSAPFGFNVIGSIPPADKITVSTSIAFTGENRTIGVNTPAVVKANVKGSVTGVQSGRLVKFELNDPKLGVFNPLTATALTDSNGDASITLTAGEITGSGTVTASIDSGEKSAPFGFNVIGSIPPTDKITVSASIAFTGANSTIALNTPAVVTANVKGATTGVQVGKLVKFELNDPTLGVFNPLTGTALTDANGNASITLTAGQISGSGTVTASLDSGEKSAPVGFSVIGNVPQIDIVTVSTTIAFTGTNSAIGIDTPAVVTANVKGSISGAQSGRLVKFALNDTNLGTFTPSTGTAITDANGNASVTLSTANINGAGTVIASLDSGEKSSPVGFTMKGDGGGGGNQALVSLSLTDVNGTPIDTISSTKPGKLVATVSGIANKKVIVTFSSTLGDLPIKTAVTDSSGKASVDVYAGSQPGAAEATASLATGEKGQHVFVIGATNVLIGAAEGTFVAGKASISAASISAGGTATVSVKLQDDQGNPFTEPVDVKFSSTCASKTTPEAELSSPVAAIAGVATSTYLAKGCVGDDNISVTANVGGKTLSASGILNVIAADAGSIVFVSAAPENISIKGTGGDESSTVKFKVLDTNGNPVANKSVLFSLNTAIGGLTLTPSTATTNSQGIAQTVVTSGTVATTVRVTASIVGSTPLITSQSNVLVISTGKPDQDSFSLSAEKLNAEGWDIDGTEVKVTARLADAFNNPVPNGTAVYFTSEGGSIDPSCVTVKGSCTVVWRSQNARPEGVKLIDGAGSLVKNPSPDLVEIGGRYYGKYGQEFGGRATITATVVGEESFPDTNGNGRFDESELNAFLTGKDVSGQGYDLTDAFVDYNEDGRFNPQQTGGQSGGDNEKLVDFDVDGQFDTADGKYNGVLCSQPVHAGCAAPDSQSLFVRQSLVIVMSGSTAYATPRSDVVIVDKDGVTTGGSIDINGKSTASVTFSISDLHNQQMPAGTKVKFATSSGSIASTSEYTWPSTNYNGARQFSVTVKGADQPESGVFTVTVTTPGGTSTEVLSIPVNIY